MRVAQVRPSPACFRVLNLGALLCAMLRRCLSARPHMRRTQLQHCPACLLGLVWTSNACRTGR